ncbi:MAG: LamG domain-containing protein [Sedimentisphaerales bacterium]|nr:LamG domain-containing protein [Sedimentisphaerales bacterium]
MKERMYLPFLAIPAFVTLVFGAVVDDFEGGVGSWTPGGNATLSATTTGATSGTGAMQIDVSVADWQTCAIIDARAYHSLLGVPGVSLSMDVTVSPGEFTGTWMNAEIVINGENAGWNPLGGLDLIRDGEPHTYIWTPSADLIQTIADTEPGGWFELFIITNTDAETRRFYVDNVQILEATSPVTDYPFGELVGDFEEEDLDGWLTNDATFTQSDTGVTRGDWALQSDIAEGGWHIHGRLDANPYGELLSQGARIVMDITVFDEDMDGTWMNAQAVINGENAGWNPLTAQDLIRDGSPHTYTWILPSDLIETIATVDPGGWFELMIVTNNDATSTRIYVDNIWLYQPQTAEYPDPVDGATSVEYIPQLSWIGGAGANQHDVYFGTNPDSLADVNRDNLDQYPDVLYALKEDTQFEPGILSLSTPYYWRVDAVDANSLTGEILDMHVGRVWSFTVADYMVIDDFESYADLTELMTAWIDANNIETEIAQSGVQCMKVVYDNTDSPFISKASYTLPDQLIDWTQQNLGSLDLYFHGDPNNILEAMYIHLVDGDTNESVVFYDGALENLTLEQWNYWQIPLRNFTGVDLSNIVTMTIGFGDPLNPAAGGKGEVYFDDVRLYQGRCLLDKRTETFAMIDFAPLGIPGGDCWVNDTEMMIMVNDWLLKDQVMTTSEADPNEIGGLVAHYKLNEGQGDQAASDANGIEPGTLYNGVTWISPGYDGTGSAVHVNGTPNSRINIGTWDPSEGTGQLTLSVWIRWAGNRTVEHQGIIGKRDGWAATDAMRWFLETDPLGRLAFRQYWEAAVDMYSPEGVLDPFVGEWAHVAVTFDGTTAVIYLNGVEVISGPFALADKPDAAMGIGCTHGAENGEVFEGDIDEVQIYNRALSAEEVAYLADLTPGDGQLHVPVASKANLSNNEPEGEQSINLADFAVLAEYWLSEQMYP